MPNELFLKTRQRTKIRNAFVNNTSTHKKLSKAQVSKTVQSGGSFGSWLDNFANKALANISVFIAKDNLPELVSGLTSNERKKFERKIVEKEK